MSKKTIAVWFFSFLSILHSNSNAQMLNWARDLGVSSGGMGYTGTLDAQNNVYITGVLSGNIFVSKIDPYNNLIWTKTMNGIAYPYSYSIELDQAGNIYTTGMFVGTTDFDPGPGAYNLTPSGPYDIFVSKLDPAGNFLWAKKIGGSNSDQAFDIVTDSNGNLYLVGETYSTSSINQIYITKMNGNGTTIWSKAIGDANGGGQARSIALDSLNNLYVTGSFYNTIDFDPGIANVSLTAYGGEIFISKFDNNGNIIWAKELENNGNGSQMANCIETDAAGNVFVSGIVRGVVDFDPDTTTSYILSSGGTVQAIHFISKFGADGSFGWAKSLGNTDLYDKANSFSLDAHGNIYMTGKFEGVIDIDPGITTHNLISQGLQDVFLGKFDNDGNFIWGNRMGNATGDFGYSIKPFDNKSFYLIGQYSGTVNFDVNNGFYAMNASGSGSNAFIAQYVESGILGSVYNDINENCLYENTEVGLAARYAVINPGNIIVQTDNGGHWHQDSLPAGNYSITYDISGNWLTTCPTTMYFAVIDSIKMTEAPHFGLVSTQPCPSPEVSISVPFLRRCFSGQLVYVQACNQNIATGVLNNAYTEIHLDPIFTVNSASLPYTDLGNNLYHFDLGTINPGQCVNFTINTTVSCDAVIGQTLCMNAQLYPADSCVFDTLPPWPLPTGPGSVSACTLPWDHSSVGVTGSCQNDTVYFTVSNTGTGNMQCYAPVRVYLDGVLHQSDSVLLNAEQSTTFTYFGNGQTWVIQADQHPLHPGNSHPTAHIEACGDTSNWTPGLINNFALNDADPVVDEYCGVVTASFDPNDKTGFPTGLGTLHEILPNQQLQYLVRFQNTGNDTAFTVVVRDTLDNDLNIFSVVPGTASHSYTFRMYGPRVLEWTFNNIMLPDSTMDEPGSHGFLTFRVDQNPNLPNGATILNDADIYFDFNAPVITNQTLHTINHWLNAFAVGINTTIKSDVSGINVYPNPTTGAISIDLQESTPKTEIIVFNLLGKEVQKTELRNAAKAELNIDGESGIYFIKITSGTKTAIVKVVKL
jgi:uncharacterized repeat protein (TIGR01451 family)